MSNLSITTKTDNKTRSDVAANKKIPASEINEMVSWMNSPNKAQGTWDASVDIDMNESGTYSAHTATGNETWNFANLTEGNVKWLPLTTDGTYTFTAGTNSSVYVGSLGKLTSGTYLIGLGVIAGEVRISVPGSNTQTQLDTPLNFQASAGNTQVSLSWSSSQGATGYTLEFSTDQTTWTNTTTLGSPYNGTSTNYTHTGLTNDITVYYRVKATASGYTDSPYSQTSATPTQATQQLSAVTLTVITPSSNQISITFTNPNSGNEDDNLIQYSTDNFSADINNGAVLASGATSGVQTGLSNGTLIYIRVISRGSGFYSNSDPSNVLSATPSAIVTVSSTKSLIINQFGSNGFSLPANASLNIGSGCTVSAWVKQIAGQSMTIMADQDDSPTDLGWSFYTNVSDQIILQIWNTGAVTANYIKITSSTTLTTSFTHVLARYGGGSDSTSLDLFINGVKESSPTRADNGTFTTAGFPNNAFVSYNPFNGVQGQGHLLDEVAIMNSALSDANCQLVYGSGNTIDFANNAFTSSSLVGWWRMEDNILDETANNLDGTPINSNQYSTTVP